RRKKRRRHGKGDGEGRIRPLSPVGQRESEKYAEAAPSGSRRKGRNRRRFKARAGDGAAAQPPGTERDSARPAETGSVVQHQPRPQDRTRDEARGADPRSGAAAERRPAHGAHARDADAWGGNQPYYAALDLGTNNCRLLVAQPTRPGQFRVVDAFSRIVRLGEGLGASGRLSDEAMERSVEALRICAAKLRSRNIRRSRLIAT
ncbi:exopolyphosphatase, partial [Rhizobium sp. TRM95111]|uniref:Ppx/GppA phosphatase family protein n=1 Tax=Rhizobium alarense TaxID=2846851 RepID=UPI0038B42C5E|nr:exopolyphosphatase [Rhizobium alarense]